MHGHIATPKGAGASGKPLPMPRWAWPPSTHSNSAPEGCRDDWKAPAHAPQGMAYLLFTATLPPEGCRGERKAPAHAPQGMAPSSPQALCSRRAQGRPESPCPCPAGHGSPSPFPFRDAKAPRLTPGGSAGRAFAPWITPRGFTPRGLCTSCTWPWLRLRSARTNPAPHPGTAWPARHSEFRS